ncbi:MAG: SMC-Scp complex subunit ScpB [Clostridia bacterium]|nr:SMC-Scp complex subunit ScpB [Clostridia bacterium]
MEFSKEQRIIEAILFSAGREVSSKELMNVLEISEEDIEKVIQNMKSKYEENGSALEIIKVDNSYQLCTKKEMYEYIYPIIDNRTKPTISNAALETLSIIAYNPKITRSEIESIRGVSVDGTIYKLLEYNLIEDAGKLDAPGRPTTYKVTNNFLKMFGISSLDELPELPRYKLDENEQIVIDDMLKENETIEETNEENLEAPMPAREDIESQKKESNED